MVTSMSEPSPQRHRYGSDPSQFADLHLPARRRRPGTVALLHGGWWGPRFGADNLDAVAADLAGRGWVAWNIEYRRLGLGGGYPSTLQDAAAAIDHLATLADVDTERVVAVGHSAGGHLAAWAAGRTKLAGGAPGAEPVIQIAGVISLAGVLDLGAAAREKLGNGAVIELMGGDPDEYPDRYAVAEPPWPGADPSGRALRTRSGRRSGPVRAERRLCRGRPGSRPGRAPAPSRRRPLLGGRHLRADLAGSHQGARGALGRGLAAANDTSERRPAPLAPRCGRYGCATAGRVNWT